MEGAAHASASGPTDGPHRVVVVGGGFGGLFATRFLRRAPVDVTTDEGARLLQCFVWAGQDERLERLTRAIDVVRESPPELVLGDIGEELPHVLGDGPTIVFQTAVFGYVDDRTVQSVRETLSQPRELAFVSAGGGRSDEPAWGLRIFRPGHEREFVGHADFHGAWLDYAL